MAKHSGAGKQKPVKKDRDIPAVIVPEEDAPAVVTKAGTFDLEDPVLPAWVKQRALTSGGYPYDEEMKEKKYERALELLQVELAKLQLSAYQQKQRLLVILEGRDAAGKGGTITAISENMNPRFIQAVALPKPTDVEASQWYFQRYVAHFPAGGEIVLFDRSWYNRAGVEKIMGFCTESQYRAFLQQAPALEKMLVEDGIVLFKFYLDIGREMQLKRFHDRRHDPLKIWKMSPIDYAALTHWDAYSKARDAMLAATHTKETPWTVVLANDKKRAHLAVIQHILGAVDYRGKDKGVVGTPDERVLGGPRLIN
jgi:polyphosphate kinase 2